MFDICCVGHITLDTVITHRSVVNMPGGTSFYFSSAIRNMDVSYTLVTSLGPEEMHIVEDLRSKGTHVTVLPGSHTVYFENSYPENMDHRTQRVLQKANPFTAEQLVAVDAAIYHLGPLLADDIPVDLIKALSVKGMVSLDVQGYLRTVKDLNVHAIDWSDKKEALQYVHILKANESEMEVLTGHSDVRSGAIELAGWGIKEVIITLGSKGSVIYKDGIFYDIPAYSPETYADATGCGDTYMAGYLYQRIKGAGTQKAGEFASAMAGLKIERSGPFTGSQEDVLHFRANSRKIYFQP